MNHYTVDGFVKATDKYTQGKIAALREVREIVRPYIGTELNPQSVCDFIDALIKREEGR